MLGMWASDALDRMRLARHGRTRAELLRYVELGGRVAVILATPREFCGTVERCTDAPFCAVHSGAWTA